MGSSRQNADVFLGVLKSRSQFFSFCSFILVFKISLNASSVKFKSIVKFQNMKAICMLLLQGLNTHCLDINGMETLFFCLNLLFLT